MCRFIGAVAASMVILSGGFGTTTVCAQQEVPESFARNMQITRASSWAVVLNTKLGTIRALHKKIAEVASEFEKEKYRRSLRIHAGVSRELIPDCQWPILSRACDKVIMVASHPLSNPGNSWLIDCLAYEADTVVGLSVLSGEYLKTKGALLNQAFDPIEKDYLSRRAAEAPLCQP